MFDVPAVLEVELKDYRSKDIGVMAGSGVEICFTLSDCNSGELLWKSDVPENEARGFLIKAFESDMEHIIEKQFWIPIYKRK